MPRGVKGSGKKGSKKAVVAQVKKDKPTTKKRAMPLKGGSPAGVSGC